jgi:peptide/nickel transport system permease protein
MALPVADLVSIPTDGLGDTEELALASRRRRISAHLELWLPLGFLILMAAACFLWPLIHTIPNPVRGNLGEIDLPPLSPHHLFGTDPLGNDVFSRILYGGRVSLEVGFGTALIGIVVGGGLGMYAASKGGLIDTVVMRVFDTLLAFPSLVLAIVVATYLGPSELHVIWAISFFSIPAFARIARANTLRLRERTFVIASKMAGMKDWRILVLHLAPNVLSVLMTFGLLGVAISIIVEASLSFLGLGVPPPGPSWGNMIATGQANMTSLPDLIIIPSAFLFATVLALNLSGDALRARWGA